MVGVLAKSPTTKGVVFFNLKMQEKKKNMWRRGDLKIKRTHEVYILISTFAHGN